MTTGPFPIAPDADPADGTATITPVTAEMMEHAAHEAAATADQVAHEAADTISETHHASDRAAPDPEPATVVETPEAEPAAAIAAIAPAVRDAPAVRETTDAAVDGLGLLNAKVMEIAAANLSAAGDFVSALLGATSTVEIAAINADHLRRRLDALTTQGRDVMVLAQKVALEAMRFPGDGSHRT